MPLSLLRRWVGTVAAAVHRRPSSAVLFEQAQDLLQSGDLQGAIKAYRAYLETEPYDVRALNDLGGCLMETGAHAEGRAKIELAHQLDDTFVPAMVAYAKVVGEDHKRGADAMKLLRRAKLGQPGFAFSDTVYAALIFRAGQAARATRFHQRSWFSWFDNRRLPDAALFSGAYDSTELRIAAEHRFWAETLKPLPPLETQLPQRPRAEGRIRLGYWSADFRRHSVRYFFRPVLENHDRERFEIVLLHDCPVQDEQTALIRAVGDEFHDVHEMPDAELRAFMVSLNLDVLVEMSGHTSFNRMSLLQDRLARLQVNAIGYPPTTGLRTVDAKLIDAHVQTDADDRYYSEKPMVLPGSFWCYDPLEDVEPPGPPPVLANGYVTFACVGNISKITAPALAAWKAILERVPDARLLIRAITFEDDMALTAMREALQAAGLPMERIDLRLPEGTATFHTSYHEIDLILDTFPFNGGTTTCFATYMGVPVVTVAGESLISRMGLSIMTNLGAPELVVGTFDEYVERAVATAADVGFLTRFRAEARERYRSTALGNGKIFTREFEQACERMLAEKEAGTLVWEPRLPHLSESELMRRAYVTFARRQIEATQRIAAYCERAYPESGKPGVLLAQLLMTGGGYDQAAELLRSRMDRYPPPDRISALLVLVRLYLLRQDHAQAGEMLERLARETIVDGFDRMQVDLCAAAVAAATAPAASAAADPARAEQVLFLVPCDDPDRFAQVEQQVRSAVACPAGWTLRFERTEEWQRMPAYESALRRDDATLLVLLQKNASIHKPSFLVDLQQALESADLVGCAGARRWTRMDWREDEFAQKTGCFLIPSGERAGMLDLLLFGLERDALVAGLAVLDGTVLALRPRAHDWAPFNEALRSAGTLLEEAWSWSCAQRGLRLGVHRNLGVCVDPAIELDDSDGTDARVAYAIERSFDPFANETEDSIAVSVPVTDPARGVAVCAAFLRGSGA